MGMLQQQPMLLFLFFFLLLLTCEQCCGGMMIQMMAVVQQQRHQQAFHLAVPPRTIRKANRFTTSAATNGCGIPNHHHQQRTQQQQQQLAMIANMDTRETDHHPCESFLNQDNSNKDGQNDIDSVCPIDQRRHRSIVGKAPHPQRRRTFVQHAMQHTMVALAMAAIPPQHATAITDTTDGTDSSTLTTTTSDTNSQDLTSRLFNPDGSLKDNTGMEIEAKTQTISWTWSTDLDENNNLDRKRMIVMDGNVVGTASTITDSYVTLSYRIPAGWNPQTYVDPNAKIVGSTTTTDTTSCQHITIYRVPQPVPMDQLSKATKMGIVKALDIPDNYRTLLSQADLLGGRTHRSQQPQPQNPSLVYYEFDMAVAPKTCPTSTTTTAATGADVDNLQLGFCPYEQIFLLSAVAIPTDSDNKATLYVCCIEANRYQWKRANAELRRIQRSFNVVVPSSSSTA